MELTTDLKNVAEAQAEEEAPLAKSFLEIPEEPEAAKEQPLSDPEREQIADALAVDHDRAMAEAMYLA